MIEYIYEFRYTDCIYESGYYTISVHKTLKGAYKAMRKFLTNSYMEWYNERITYGKYNFDSFVGTQSWKISKTKLEE